MHPCPCCGYKTLPGRGDYDVCPVCSWEDERAEPWEYSGPNGLTLVEAQRDYLAQRRPHRLRAGNVRAPKRHEARDPDWRPFDLTDDLLGRVKQSHVERQRSWDEEQRRVAEEIADDPEGPFKEYNAAMRALKAEAADLPHREVQARLRDLSLAQGLKFSAGQLELFARRLQDEAFYRRHPVRAAWWLVRYSRPTTFTRRWAELRTGRATFAG